MNKDWYQIGLSDIDTPALIIDRDKARYNIQQAIAYAGGTDRLRPHVKTHKMLEVARMEKAEGISKFKCSTIAEAEMLGMARAEDVLIAYPVQGPKIARVQALVSKFPDTHFSILVDNEDTAAQINEQFQSFGRPVDVFIDIDNGYHRSGISPEGVERLANVLEAMPYIQLRGLHCYDGHVRMPSLEERVARGRQAFGSVLKLRAQLEEKWGRVLSVVAGGSPSFSVHAKYHDVECSPGTFIFWDEGYANRCQEQEFQKAAVLATRVISKIDAFTYCLDLGHKSVASEFPFPRVAFIHPGSFTQIGHSEEHLVIRSATADVLRPGQLLLAYPYHICPTVALYDKVYVVSGGQLSDEWEVTARNRKITV